MSPTTRNRRYAGMRINLPACLLSVFSMIALDPAGAATRTTTRYACEGGLDLLVERDANRAHVRLAGRSYELRRKPSSIGAKYLSEAAALIIDGRSAVFVGGDPLRLGTCNEVAPEASTR
jgi:hypothetical protein